MLTSSVSVTALHQSPSPPLHLNFSDLKKRQRQVECFLCHDRVPKKKKKPQCWAGVLFRQPSVAFLSPLLVWWPRLAWIFTVSEKQNQEDKYRNIERPLRRDWLSPSAICKLEVQERQWCGSSQTQRPENQESNGVSLTLGLRARESGELMCRGRSGGTSQLKQRGNSPFPRLVVLFGPSRDWMMPIHTGKGGLIYSVYQLNAHLFQKHP